MGIKELLQKESVRYALVLLLGITVGVLFYPVKRVEDRLTAQFQQEISTLKQQHATEISTYKETIVRITNESKQLKEESEKKLTKLASEIRDLKSKQKTSYYKIVRPDGTVEIKKFSESEVSESTKVIVEIQEEFKNKVEQIETKWSDIHKERVSNIQKEFNAKELEYKNTITQLEKYKNVSVNEKRFGLEIGLLSNKSYYGHATMDVWGPFFLGVHGELSKDNDSRLGAGIGLRF